MRITRSGRAAVTVVIVALIGGVGACESSKPIADPGDEVVLGSPEEEPTPVASKTLEPLAEIQVTAFERKVDFEFTAQPDTTYELQIIDPDDVATSRQVTTGADGKGEGTYRAKASGTYTLVVVNAEGQVVAKVTVDVA